jgi:Pathogenicity locus
MNQTDCNELEDLPNVGPAVAGDLRLLGITRPKQLCGRDPYKLYEQLCRVTGQGHDPCLIDTFISIVRFMDGEPAKPWWKYTSERKREMARRAKA